MSLRHRPLRSCEPWGDETAHAIAPPGAPASRRARDETAAAGVGEEERHRAGVVEVAVERATTRRGDVLVRRAECLGAARARRPGGRAALGWRSRASETTTNPGPRRRHPDRFASRTPPARRAVVGEGWGSARGFRTRASTRRDARATREDGRGPSRCGADQRGVVRFRFRAKTSEQRRRRHFWLPGSSRRRAPILPTEFVLRNVHLISHPLSPVTPPCRRSRRAPSLPSRPFASKA